MKKLSRGKRLGVGLLDAIGEAAFFLNRVFRSQWKEYGEVRKILVLELWGIGDLVMATAALGALRDAFPTAKIALLGKSHARVLLEGSPWVDTVITCDLPWTALTGKYRPWRYNLSELVRLILQLRREQFDLAICARMDPRNNLLMFLSGARRRVGYGYFGGAYFLSDVVPVDLERPHRVEEWLALLRWLGVEAKDPRPRLPLAPEERNWAEAVLTGWGVRPEDLLVGIHPGARIAVRRWDLRKFAALGDALVRRHRARLLVFVDADGYGAEIPMEHEPIIVQSSLREMMALIARCGLIVCNDSGPMHLATAVGTPVAAIFGPTKVEWFGPYGEDHRVVIQDGFPCRPCYDQCIFDQPYCITTIPVEAVLSAVEERLAKLQSRSTGLPVGPD